MHCLVQSQVLGISPEGLLCQFVLADGRPHNLVPGKSWTLVPFPAPSVGDVRAKPRLGQSRAQPGVTSSHTGAPQPVNWWSTSLVNQ